VPQDLAAGRTGKEATAVTAKREHILEMPLVGVPASGPTR
jgi:hypothetical protein